MRVIAVAARSANNMIGINNGLPWPHNHQDLTWFKRLTLGDPMIMGRKTFESLPGILPGRPHFVVSSRVKSLSVVDSNCAVLPMEHVDELLEGFRRGGRNRVFIVGGGQLFETLAPKCDMLLLRTFDKEHEGDTEFPMAAFSDMKCIAKETWIDSITETYTRTMPWPA